MRILKNLKAFSGHGRCMYIKIVLKEIELIKKIFILDIEQGEEVALPIDLNYSKLPLSYQFYDPTLNMIEAMVTEEIRG